MVTPCTRPNHWVLQWGFTIGKKTNFCKVLFLSLRMRGGYRVIRFRTVQNIFVSLFAVCTFCLTMAGVSLADDQNARNEIYSIDLPKQSVAKSLNDLAVQTGAQFLFSYDLVESRVANPVFGQYTLVDAVALLLQGTRLRSGLDNGILTISAMDGGAEFDIQNREGKKTVKANKYFITPIIALLLGAGNAYGQDAVDADAKVEKNATKKVKTDKKKDEIVITGTRIARDNYNMSSPIKVIEAIEFERTGATSAFELLSLLPEVGAGGIFDSAPFASGTGDANAVDGGRGGFTALGANSISLRSLGPNATLILVNGRRVAPHGFTQGGTSNANTVVNLDNIPVEAIERIEILKGGASTIYGTDAMAGVINIILKKGYSDMRSLTANVRMTTEGDNAQYRLAYSQGFSDIGGGDNSLLLSGEYVHQNSLILNAREAQASRSNSETNYSPGGTLGEFDFSTFTYAYRPYNLANPNAAACERISADNECLTDIGDLTDLTPKSDRFALTATYDQSLQNGVDLFATATFAHANRVNRLAPTQWYEGGLVGAEDLFVQLTDTGNRTRTVTGTNYSLVLGAKGQWNDKINWEISSRYSSDSETSTYHNYVLETQFETEAAAGNYIFGVPGATPQDVLDRIHAPDFKRRGSSKTAGIDAHISGELFQGPAGPISYAVGGTFTRDSFSDRPDPLADIRNLFQGAIDAPYGTVFDSSRTRTAVFGELLVPVIQDRLEIELAAREDFDDLFGSHFSPKIGFRLDAIPNVVMVRGAYTEGFRAPSIVEFGRPTQVNNNWFFERRRVATGVSYNCLTVTARNQCLGIKNTTLDNPNIKPEVSEQYNFGVVLNPFTGLELAADWYLINRTNEIRFFGGENSANTHPDTIGFDAAGNVISVVSFYTNIGRTENQGVDFSARYTVDLGKYGELTNDLSVIHDLSNITERLNARNALFTVEHKAGFRGQPAWRATNSLSWLMGDWRTTMVYRYRGSYNDWAASSESLASRPCNTGGGTALKYNCMVPSFSTVDFNLGYSGIKNVRLTFNVRNLFNGVAETDIAQTGARNVVRIGREVSFRANYRF